MNLHLPLDIFYPITRRILRQNPPENYIESIGRALASTHTNEETSHLKQDLIVLLGYADQDFTLFFEDLKFQPEVRTEPCLVRFTLPFYQLNYYADANFYEFHLRPVYNSQVDPFGALTDREQTSLDFGNVLFQDEFKNSVADQISYVSEVPLKMEYASTNRETFESLDEFKYHLSSYKPIFIFTKKGTVQKLLTQKDQTNLFYWFDTKRITMFQDRKRIYNPSKVYNFYALKKKILTDFEPELGEKLYSTYSQDFLRCINNRLWLDILEEGHSLQSVNRNRQRRTLYHLKKKDVERARREFYGTSDPDIFKRLMKMSESRYHEDLIQFIEALEKRRDFQRGKEFLLESSNTKIFRIVQNLINFSVAGYSKEKFLDLVLDKDSYYSMQYYSTVVFDLIKSFDELKTADLDFIIELEKYLVAEFKSYNLNYEVLQSIYFRQLIVSFGFQNLTPTILNQT